MPGAEVVARVVVAVDPQAVGAGTEARAVESRAAGVVVDQVPPAELVGLDGQRRVAVVALGREAAGVDQQRRLARPAGRAAGSRVSQVMRTCVLGRSLVAQRLPLEDLLQAAAEDGQHGAAFLVARGIAAVDRQRQGLDAQGRHLLGRPAAHLVDEPAEAVVVHVRQRARAGRQNSPAASSSLDAPLDVPPSSSSVSPGAAGGTDRLQWTWPGTVATGTPNLLVTRSR